MASQNHPLPQLPSAAPQNAYSQYGGPYQQQPTAYQQYAPPQSPVYQGQPYTQSFPDYALQQQQQQQQQQQYQQVPPRRTPPQQQYQPRPQDQHQRQQSQTSRPPLGDARKSRTFSFRSDGSRKSNDLHETPAEKEAKRLHSKADPTLAMSEAEPGVVAATVKSSLASLRSMKHRDANGNTIDDPDWSNPTRSRWERPLDTIRSFEAAIDGGDNSHRRSVIRADTDSMANWNRRSSAYVTSGNTNGGRFPYPRDSYYGGRPPSMMPNQRYDQYGGQDGFPEQQGPQGYNAYSNPPRQRFSRMASEPQYYTPRQAEQHVYPMPTSNQRSYETVASGSGSGTSGEPAGYQTDPTSSENSSIDRVQAPPKPMNDYGIGFSQNPTTNYTLGFNGSNNAPAAATPPQGYPSRNPINSEPPPPAVPRKESVILRKPTRNAAGPPVSMASGPTPQRPELGEKRKSWLARRFSKKA